ncbi:restriction endonuclease subunit S [Sporosarcina aquimarina]|uniref:restriction endonuclease subunit S n=1 Tax=Sporosarcina aquimarina TaxID=114975 RepID=UPI001C8E3D11|nr:restriction endonuclease subunit S [Sporosarcina aquimarina]MBY0221779.1 restriction endonuclease subunit S [Sporosarcina aquimarina]
MNVSVDKKCGESEVSVSWLGGLPSSWKVSKVKYQTKINERVLSETTSPDFEMKYIDIGSVDSTGNIKEIETLRFENAPSRARRIIRSGDTLVSTVRTYLKAITAVRKAPSNLIASTGFAVLTPRETIDSIYLAYLMQSAPYVDEIVSRSTGVSYPAINASEIGNLECILPSLDTQRDIVNYLDARSSEIDSLITDKEKLIALLEEKLQSVITEAVIKGLNPSVKMKDSGVDWIGEIPEHWNEKKIAWIFEIIGSGGTPLSTNSSYYDGDVAWLNTGDLNDGYVGATSKNVTQLALKDYSTLKKFPSNSLVVAMYGATIGKLGITEIETTTNQACCVLAKPIDSDLKFIFYWFLANRKEIINLSYGGGQPNISQGIIKSLKISLPPMEEQVEITNYLNDRYSEITSIKLELKEQIQKLKEYRQSLIYEAVTGKIDVREYIERNE